MKKQSRERKRFVSLIPWTIFVIVSCSSGFNACTNNSGPAVENIPSKDSQLHKIVPVNHIVSTPAIPIPARIPKNMLAGKPILRTDSSNGGAPFFTNYDTEQGLASTTVTCSASDKWGNLWFGTVGGGISRYDGKSFTNYNTAQGLAGNVVFCILVDKESNLWICTSSGVSKYDGKRFVNFTTAQGLADNLVGCAIEDRNGNIWFGTRGEGLSKFDGSHFTNYTTLQGLADNYVSCLLQDKDGSLWIGTNTKGIDNFDGNKFINYTTMNGLANNSVNSIAQDKEGSLWFGTVGGLTKKAGGNFFTYTTALGLADNSVSCVMPDKSGNLWAGTSVGISIFNGSHFTNFTKAQGLPENDISSLLQDKIGNIWITSYSGVTKYKGNSFMSYSTAQGLVGSIVFSIIKDKALNIWFATKTGGASRFNGSSFTNFTTAQGMRSNWIWNVFQDNAGNIWFCSDMGACKFDGKNFSTYTKASGLPTNTVFSVTQDSRQNLWFSTKEGASKFDGKRFTNYTKMQGLPDNNIQSILEDNQGIMWFGTHDGGASSFDGVSFTNYTMADGLPSNTIYRIVKDRYGVIWFGTSAGVGKFDGKGFTKYGAAEGLMGNIIWGIVDDTIKNRLWFGSNQGLSGLRQQPPKETNLQPIEFENFNEKTGYPIKDVHSLCLDSKGIIWAGCGDGKVIKFDYYAVKKNEEPLKIQVRNVKVHEENVCWNDLIPSMKNNSADSLAQLNEMVTKFGRALSPAVRINMRDEYSNITFDSLSRYYPVPINLVLPYKNNNLTIDFAAIEPDMPGQVKYQYRLSGYDKNWSSAGNNSTAVFGNIGEGKYILELKAVSPGGVVSNTTYAFTVLPPWQRTWWAYVIFFSFGIGAVWLLVARRSLALKRQNRILEEKVEDRTFQLKQSLENLKSTQSQLIQREKMASLGELTAGVAHEIQNPLNFVNNFSDLNKELLVEMQIEILAGNTQDVIDLANTIKDNEGKINLHGKRAESIVRNMLQHSRTSSGQKQLTNINAFTDEYFQLSYHGIQTKDKSLLITLQTNFDSAVGELNIVSNDIGRVLLNLFNNAFYEVSEKAKKQIEGYRPTVSVTTKKIGDTVEIRIADNGTGIPEKLVDKIFQPFFTTKPTGLGTGLGLSISYDIIKAHGGELNVVTNAGEGAVFVIQLPEIFPLTKSD